MTRNNNIKRYEKIINSISDRLDYLKHGEEDIKLINKLVISYHRKRNHKSFSDINVMAGSFLWLYSKMNFLWEENKEWMQKNIAGLFNLKPDTISAKSRELSKALKIKVFDQRFCRSEIVEQDPLLALIKYPYGFIIPKNMAIPNSKVENFNIDKTIKALSEIFSNNNKNEKDKTKEIKIYDSKQNVKRDFQKVLTGYCKR